MSAVRLVMVGKDEDGLRLDRWFHKRFPALGHGALEKMLRKGQVRVDGARVKAAHRLTKGASIRVPPMPEDAHDKARPRAEPAAASEADIRALRDLILYRDDQAIAINKPAGLAVQGGSGTSRHVDSMLDGLKFGAAERPRLVHRLDKDTGGVLLLARSAKAAAHLGAAFRGHSVRKVYWALVIGAPKPAEGRIDMPLLKAGGPGGDKMRVAEMGQEAVTLYRVVERAGQRAAWVALEPLTGRTHQLRAHMAAIGHPIVGDGKYGGAEAFLGGDVASRLHLHARLLSFPHPDGGRREIVAPLTDPMLATWRLFGFDAEREDDPA